MTFHITRPQKSDVEVVQYGLTEKIHDFCSDLHVLKCSISFRYYRASALSFIQYFDL